MKLTLFRGFSIDENDFENKKNEIFSNGLIIPTNSQDKIYEISSLTSSLENKQNISRIEDLEKNLR